jgi:bifunctional non-homologous end joining protein LigD
VGVLPIARTDHDYETSSSRYDRTVYQQRGERVYLDYLQNLPGKTLATAATAYSVRSNKFAGVSAPLRWEELTGGLRPEDFTITTLDERIKRTGDLWAVLRQTAGIDLNASGV